MSIDTIIYNSTVLDQLATALGPRFPDTGITSIVNTDNNVVPTTVGKTCTINLKPDLNVTSLTSSGTTLFNIECKASGNYAAINLDNTSVDGSSWTIYCNGTGAVLPKTLNFYNETIAKSIMTFTGTNGHVGINNTNPTSQLSVSGLQNFANNADAISGGLKAGDFYYTNTAGDGVLKVVI